MLAWASDEEFSACLPFTVHHRSPVTDADGDPFSPLASVWVVVSLAAGELLLALA